MAQASHHTKPQLDRTDNSICRNSARRKRTSSGKYTWLTNWLACLSFVNIFGISLLGYISGRIEMDTGGISYDNLLFQIATRKWERVWSKTPIDNTAVKNGVREGPVNDVVSHWRLSNNWKSIQSTNKYLSKFVSRGAMASSVSFWPRHCLYRPKP